METDILNKPVIFIVSTGRTATQFLGLQMSRMIEGSASVHEPYVLPMHRPLQSLKQLMRYGIFMTTLGKLSPRHSIYALGIARMAGKVSDEEAVNIARGLRAGLLGKVNAEVYLEANYQLCGLVDLLPVAFPNANLVFIVRDPRDWVVSMMNRRFKPYSWHDVRGWFRDARLRPHHFTDDPYRETWSRMSLFEKYCWWWARQNSFVLQRAEPIGLRIYRFEDLFGSKTRDSAFPEMLKQASVFPDGFSVEWNYNPELFVEKVDTTGKGKFPGWRQWGGEQAMLLFRHCSEIMERFGYGTEREWKDKIAQGG